MSFIDVLTKRLPTIFLPAKAGNSAIDLIEKSVPAGFFGFFAPTSVPRMNEREYARAYAGWVYACVNAIAERVADMELLLEQYKNGQWKKVESHPSLDLLNNPNDFMSFYDFVFSHEAYQQINGNTFWYLVPNGNKDLSEMWQLDPTKVSVVKDKQTYIKGYVYTPEAGDAIPLAVDEVIYYKRFTPNDQWRGVGTVQAAALAIDVDTYAVEWQRNFFGNAAVPSGLLYSEGKMSQEQYDRIRANWDAKYKGVPNAHKMAILEGGLKWQDLTPTSREMQFTESRKNTRDEILAYFGVPKPVLGILEDVNLASADAADLLFSKFKIRPRMKSFVVGLNKFYLPKFNLDSKLFRFNFVDPVPENIQQKLDIIANGRTNGWLTKNEAREMFSYEEREGGDELDESALQTPIPGSEAEDNAAQEEQDHQEEEEATDDTKSVKKNVKSKPVERTQESKKKEQDYKQEQIAALHKTYLDLNSDLEKDLLKRLKQYKSASTHRKEPQTLLKRLLRASGKANVGAANDLVKFLFSNYEDWIGLIYNATKDGLTRIFEQSGKDTFADLNLEGSFDLQNPRALDWLSQHAMEDSTSYTDTMKEDIAQVVQDGVEQGLSNEQIAGSLSDFFGGQSDYRAMRIARTETINAYGAGNLEGFKQSDVISGKFWIPDAEACPICLDNADDGVIALDDTFSSGDDAPAAHPNCECSLGGQTDENA